MDILAVKNEAELAANLAQADFLHKHGEIAYCGFAWVDVFVERTNSKEAKLLKSIGFKPSWRRKCLNLWRVGNYNGQSMDVLEAGAQAYAEVLSKYGFCAYMGSRAD
jgi:hypothetical protein